MSTLYLMQGIPGCGKSTFARKLSKSVGCLICSADYFFMKDGIYNWDSNKIGEAHKSCYDKCNDELMCCTSTIVDNTNLTFKEISKYADLADKYAAILHIYRPLHILTIDELIARGTHNVPKESIEAMINRFIPAEEMKSKLVEVYPNLVWGVSYFDNLGD